MPGRADAFLWAAGPETGAGNGKREAAFPEAGAPIHEEYDMKNVLAVLALCTTMLAGSVALAPRAIPLGLSAVALTGCFEDECDKVKQSCRDKGLVPTNCKGDKTALSDKCQCDCVSPEN